MKEIISESEERKRETITKTRKKECIRFKAGIRKKRLCN
jgi:hypothetical protein